MDEYSGKRATDGPPTRKSPGLVLKDTAKCGYQSSQDCSRLSCSSRSTSSKAPTVSFLGKTKSTKTSLNGKEIVGSSSRTTSTIRNSKKSIIESRRRLTSQSRSEAPENGGIEDEKDGSDPVPPGKIRRGLYAHSKNRDFMNVGSSSSASNSGSSISTGATNSSSVSGTGPNRYGLRNLKCNSLSDLIPPGCSSNRNHNGTKGIEKKTNSERESSSISREKKMKGSLSDGRNISTGHGFSISDSRRTRSTAPQTQNAVSSAPSRSLVNANTRTRTRLSMESSYESSAMGHQMTQRNVSINGNALSSSGRFSTEPTSRRPFSSTRVRNSNGNSARAISPVELGSTLSLENLQHYDIDGVAEVLLALERIEQDEELTYEQLMLLETRLFLNGIVFYDQHRDMRLDIDDMSYEELLALEERMGNVSTALTEDAMSRCLTRSIFDSNNYGFRCCSGDKNEVKCCICQEEYVNGDEVGRMECKHWFHEGCIQQWLRQKNWCPICKAAAELPGRPSPPS